MLGGVLEGLGGGRCLRPPVLLVDLVLALIDGAIAVVAFSQMLRIHLRNPQLGWTRQKVFHILIGISNVGFMIYFISSLFANCNEWFCWSHGCGFILMACPQILLFSAFFLLLSFWIDLCHQSSDDDDDDEENGNYEVLLEKSRVKSSQSTENRRKCCPFSFTHIGSRQRIVAIVALLAFFLILIVSLATAISINEDKGSDKSLLMSMIYLDSISSVVLLLGGALAFYGWLLFSKMSTVRSEMVITEMWKVASLASLSFVCFSTGSLLALATNIPLLVLYSCQTDQGNGRSMSVLLFSYYLIGSSVPSAFVLWVMREMPPSHARRPAQSVVTTSVSGKTLPIQNSQLWIAATTSTNQVHKASPI